ncbi:MAG TPA: Rrf2 family transcriptional regulator [bacterium]|nr:Rrf2 family transcriptional regulator [bacterium]
MITKLLNISERVNLAFHALGYIAAAGDENISAKQMAADIQVSETYLSKVLQVLVRNGYLVSKRGSGGGHVLGKRPQEITVYDIYMLFEGPLPDNSCLFDHQYCDEAACMFHGVTAKVRRIMEKEFREITVARLMKNYERRI